MVPVKTGVVFPVGEDGVEGCPVLHPAAIRSAARTIPRMRTTLADDICFSGWTRWEKSVLGRDPGEEVHEGESTGRGKYMKGEVQDRKREQEERTGRENRKREQEEEWIREIR